MELRRTYKYRLFRSSRYKRLHQVIDLAGLIWNRSIALQRRYYRLTGKYISAGRLKSHLAKLRMKTSRYEHWKLLGSQAVQELVERLDAAYQRFFQQQGGRPSFKSDCGHHQKLDLAQRVFECPHCGLRLNRDHNAARNIKRVGTSTLGLEAIRRSPECNLV